MSAVFKMDRDTLQCAWYWGLTIKGKRRPVRAVRTSAGLCLRRKGLMMDDPNMYAYGDHYPDDSDQPLPLPPEGHPLYALPLDLGPNVEFSGVPVGHSINHPAGGTSAGTQG